MTDLAGVKKTIAQLHDIGFRNLHTGTPQFMKPQEYKDLLDSFGMAALSVSGPEDPQQIAPSIPDIEAQLKIFGVKLVDIPTLPSAFRNTAQGYETYAKQLNAGGKALYEACGGVPAYHNHALEFISLGDGLCGMDILLEQTDPKYVSLILDTHWLASGGKNPPDYIHKCAGRITIMHFKDYAIDPDASFIEAVPRIFAEVGQGNLDWPAIVAACKDADVTICVSEQDICKGASIDSARISYNGMVRLGLEAKRI